MKSDVAKGIILNSFHEGKNSHAFLLVTNNIERCFLDVKTIIKQINCTNSGDDDCNICNLIEKNNNPDVIIVKPEGKEIKTESVMNIISTLRTKPLISKYSIYVIIQADKLNQSSSNKILKFLEEPEKNIIGFFITDKPQGILPTIKSRCEIYNYLFDCSSILDILNINEEEYQIAFDRTLKLLANLNETPKYLLMLEAKKISELERDEIDLMLNLLKKMYTIKYEYVANREIYDVEAIKIIIDRITTADLKKLVKRIALLDNIIDDFKFNLNKELILNRLFLLWE